MGVLARAAKSLPSSLTFGGAFDQGLGVLGRIGSGITVVATSGADVGLERALRVPAYATAVRVISEDVGAVPLISYRRTASGRKRATDHPTYRVLHDAPNPYMTSMVFRETLQAHVLSWGDAYASMVTDAQGVVLALWPLRPDRMALHADPSTGRLYWTYTLASGETRDLRHEEVFHLPGLSFDGLQGYPVLTAMMRESVGVAAAQQEYVARFYRSDARPGIYLKTARTLSENAAKRLAKDWDDRHAGLDNAHRTAVLEEGLDIGTVGINPVDQELLDSRKWSATEIAGQFRLAPWKVGVYDRATWANIEDGNIDHWQSALRAWFVRWEQQLNLQVYGVGSEVYAEHLIDGILRGNAESRAKSLMVQRQGGALTPNEWREVENRDKSTDPRADDLFAPMNAVTRAGQDAGQPGGSTSGA